MVDFQAALPPIQVCTFAELWLKAARSPAPEGVVALSQDVEEELSVLGASMEAPSKDIPRCREEATATVGTHELTAEEQEFRVYGMNRSACEVAEGLATFENPIAQSNFEYASLSVFLKAQYSGSQPSPSIGGGSSSRDPMPKPIPAPPTPSGFTREERRDILAFRGPRERKMSTTPTKNFFLDEEPQYQWMRMQGPQYHRTEIEYECWPLWRIPETYIPIQARPGPPPAESCGLRGYYHQSDWVKVRQWPGARKHSRARKDSRCAQGQQSIPLEMIGDWPQNRGGLCISIHHIQQAARDCMMSRSALFDETRTAPLQPGDIHLHTHPNPFLRSLGLDEDVLHDVLEEVD